jgi:hypothetical protein
MEGESGLATTQLTASVTETSRYLPIASAQGFLAADDRVFIRDEEIEYFRITNTASSTCPAAPCLDTQVEGRGFNDTNAASHANGTRVMNITSGLINQAVAFRVGNTDTIVGKITFPFMAGWALIKFFGRVLIWDYQWMDGNGVYFKYILFYPLSIMVIVGLIRLLRSAGGFPP